MFGIINPQNQVLSETEGYYFELMNSPKHNYSNQACFPVQSAFDYKGYAKTGCFLQHATDLVLFYEGRIFNIQSLKANLSGYLGDKPSLDKVPADILLAAYQYLGDKFVDQLKGEFSIIIYNRTKGFVKVFRDPIGMIPLYYIKREETFYFSTELRRLSIIPEFNTPDKDYFQLYLQYVIPNTYDKTWYQSIYRLPPGSQLNWSVNNEISIKKYFSFQPADLSHLKTYEEHLKAFRDKIEQAVHLQIDDADPIICQFSGGLDSTGISAISATYCQEHSIPLLTYCCGLRDSQLNNLYQVEDERTIIKGITSVSNIPFPTFVTASDTINIEDFSLKFNTNDNPFLKEVCEDMVSKKGKVLLSGFGGDECITYNQYPIFLSDAFWRGKWITFWQEGQAYGWKRMLLMVLYPFKFMDKVIQFFKPGIQIIRFLTEKGQSILVKKKHRATEITSKTRYTLAEDIIAYLTTPYISWRIETEKEFASYYDIEMRYPFLDLQLLSFFLGLPSKYKMLHQQGRRMYREAIKKWIDYEPFIEQRKSRISTVPVGLLRMQKSIAEKTIDYEALINELVPELKAIINVPDIPTDPEDFKSQIRFSQFLKLAIVNNFLKKQSTKAKDRLPK